MVLEVLKGLADSIIATYDDNKPEIMIYGGTIGLVISGIAGAVVAYKAHPAVDQLKEEIKEVEKREEKAEISKPEARKQKLGAVKRHGVKIVVKAGVIIIFTGLSVLLIHAGVHEFQRINAELVEEVAKLTATVAACQSQLAKKVGPEEALNTRYSKVDPETGVEKFVAPEDGRTSDGTYFLKLDLSKCPNTFWNKDFDERMALLRMVEVELKRRALYRVNKYGGCIIEAYEVMQAFGCWYGNDVDWAETHRDMRYVFRRGDSIDISFGLDEAQELKDFGKVDEDEIWLHINFNKGISAPSPRVVKG